MAPEVFEGVLAKDIIYIFGGGGGMQDANFPKNQRKSVMFCTLAYYINLHKNILQYENDCEKQFIKKKKEVRYCLLYNCKLYHLNMRNMRQSNMILSEICQSVMI